MFFWNWGWPWPRRGGRTTSWENTVKTMKLAVLALIAVPLLIVASGCSPECVDYADCADKAKAAKQEFTCVDNVCKAGSPFPDAGM